MDYRRVLYRVREVRGALILGSIFGVIAAVTLWIPLDADLRTGLAWLAAGASAGATWACIVTLFQVDSAAFNAAVLPISGVAGGAVFWLVSHQEQPVYNFLLIGALLVPFLFLVEVGIDEWYKKRNKPQA